MRPVEGTILTVVREASAAGEQYMKEHPEASIDDVFNCILDESRISLANTPELLPVLKEVGVVDSGGTGLVVILEGFKAVSYTHLDSSCDLFSQLHGDLYRPVLGGMPDRAAGAGTVSALTMEFRL